MSIVTIYSKPNCVNCNRAKFQLKVKGVEYEEVQLTDENKRFLENDYKCKITSVPMITHESKIYTFHQLSELLQNLN